MIHICLCFDQALADKWKHLINSIQRNTEEDIHFHFFIPEGIRSAIVDTKKITYHFLKIPTPLPRFTQYVRSPAMFYRWAIPEILQDQDRAIYLDNDVIVQGDIADLWNMDLQGNLIGAVRDPFHDEIKQTLFFQGKMPIPFAHLEKEKSFLSGQLLMDLKALREGDYIRDIFHLIEEYKIRDMLAMNLIFHGKILELDREWSAPLNQLDPKTMICRSGNPRTNNYCFKDAKILHSHGDRKFWEKGHPFNSLYRSYL